MADQSQRWKPHGRCHATHLAVAPFPQAELQPGGGNAEPGAGFVVIGTIVMFHISDEVYKDGRIDLEALNPVGRLAGNSYTRVFDNFKVIRKVKPD